MTPKAPGLAPSQTVGPFFLHCLLRPDARRNVLVGSETAGERIRIEGRILDGDGAGVPDAVIEIWQANSRGRYHHPSDGREAVALDPSFIGFGRSGTDEEGCYWFETIRPGAVPAGAGGGRMQAPHVGVMIFARGLLNHLATRLYFVDDPANAEDPTLECVPAERRGTLLARQRTIDGHTAYRWDVILQGPGETAFFNL